MSFKVIIHDFLANVFLSTESIPKEMYKSNHLTLKFQLNEVKYHGKACQHQQKDEISSIRKFLNLIIDNQSRNIIEC